MNLIEQLIERAKEVIAAAEKDLGPLSFGECSDLLQDQGVAEDWQHAHALLHSIGRSE